RQRSSSPLSPLGEGQRAPASGVGSAEETHPQPPPCREGEESKERPVCSPNSNDPLSPLPAGRGLGVGLLPKRALRLSPILQGTMRMLRVVFCPSLTLALTPALHADWPQFRGPGSSGVADDQKLPEKFSPKENLAWKVAVPPGASSPIVVGDKIVLTAFEDG